jgi:predicted DNA-binding protein YlxM (UPF0122 family)
MPQIKDTGRCVEIDKLEKILRDLSDGVISEEECIHTLKLEAHSEDSKADAKQYNLLMRRGAVLVESYIGIYGKMPDEMLIEQENLNEMLKLVADIKAILLPEEYKLLYLWTVRKFSFEQIAKRQGTYKMQIHRRLMKIRKKLLQYAEKNKYIVKDILISRASKQTAKSPSLTVGLIHEYLQHVAVNGRWKIRRDGRKEFVSQTLCKLPEELHASFKDTKTCCPLCSTDWGEDLCRRR